MTEPKEFHAARWNEPVVMEMGRPGARGQLFPATAERPEMHIAATIWEAPRG